MIQILNIGYLTQKFLRALISNTLVFEKNSSLLDWEPVKNVLDYKKPNSYRSLKVRKRLNMLTINPRAFGFEKDLRLSQNLPPDGADDKRFLSKLKMCSARGAIYAFSSEVH